MDTEEFVKTYGKIKYLDHISERHPVIPMCKNDINRKLMIKFKYSNLTSDEENEFHDAIKKMIYKVMHKNNIMMEWDDVYQEIWRKIVRSRHTWKEWKGTMVSTWITIVANSVINTLRQNLNKYNSRFCLYDDVVFNQRQGEDQDGNRQDKCDRLMMNAGRENLEDKGIHRLMFNEQYSEFMSKLDKAESFVFGIILSMQDDILDAYDGRLKIPYGEIRSKSGYDETTFAMVIYNIKKKYCDTFGIKFNEFAPPPKEADDFGTEFLF